MVNSTYECHYKRLQIRALSWPGIFTCVQVLVFRQYNPHSREPRRSTIPRRPAGEWRQTWCHHQCSLAFMGGGGAWSPLDPRLGDHGSHAICFSNLLSQKIVGGCKFDRSSQYQWMEQVWLHFSLEEYCRQGTLWRLRPRLRSVPPHDERGLISLLVMYWAGGGLAIAYYITLALLNGSGPLPGKKAWSARPYTRRKSSLELIFHNQYFISLFLTSWEVLSRS